MNRQLVINKVVLQLQETLKITLRAQKESEKASQEAPSRMEARFDSRKEEMASLVRAQSRQINDTEKTIEYFSKLKNNNNETVGEGCIVELSDGRNFLVSKLGGGLTVDFDSKMISVVTLQSLLGQQLIGKRIGDFVRVSYSQLKIKSIS